MGACQVRADSRLGGINSLFSKTGLPVVVELIPLFRRTAKFPFANLSNY